MKAILGVLLFCALIVVGAWIFWHVWPKEKDPLKDWQPPSKPQG